jgi:hypothetical protein
MHFDNENFSIRLTKREKRSIRVLFERGRHKAFEQGMSEPHASNMALMLLREFIDSHARIVFPCDVRCRQQQSQQEDWFKMACIKEGIHFTQASCYKKIDKALLDTIESCGIPARRIEDAMGEMKLKIPDGQEITL